MVVNSAGTCVDGDPCTDGDLCVGGACKGGTDICPCKQDSDCVAKDDGDLCNGTLYCAKTSGGSACKLNPATKVHCATVDDNACSLNTCQGKTGACALIPQADNKPCDADGNPCTPVDTCSKGACVADTNICACQTTADCAAKEDGDLCNGTLFCDKSLAKPRCRVNPATLKSCPSVDDTACKHNVCQPKTGTCQVEIAPNETPCDDANPCSKADVCASGDCVAGLNICACVTTADCVSAEDGNACNGALICAPFPLAGPGKKRCVVDTATVVDCQPPPGQVCDSLWCDPSTGTCKSTGCKALAKCGDGKLEGAEQCDDGNQDSDDGCSASCVLEHCVAWKVSTFAGSGVAKDIDGDGTKAGVYYPCGIAIDKNGALYVASRTPTARIRKITAAGAVTTLAGGVEGYKDGKGTAARFDEPCGLAVDGSGDVYVADRNNLRLRKITPDGTTTTFAGSWDKGLSDGTGTSAKFWYPVGLALSASGVLYVGDSQNHAIRSVSMAADVGTIAGAGNQFAGKADGLGPTARFNDPTGLAIDTAGFVIVADRLNDRIRRVSPTGQTSTLAGTVQGYADGKAGAKFSRPEGVAADGYGNVWVADTMNHRIRRIAADGNVTTAAGAPIGVSTATAAGYSEGIGAAARFDHPQGLATDGPGRLLVADTHNNRIRLMQCLTWTTAKCGNGLLDAGEACDDGNLVATDGCSNQCQ